MRVENTICCFLDRSLTSLEESVVRGIEFCSMSAAGATIETEETRINDRMLKNIMYYRSAYDC